MATTRKGIIKKAALKTRSKTRENVAQKKKKDVTTNKSASNKKAGQKKTLSKKVATKKVAAKSVTKKTKMTAVKKKAGKVRKIAVNKNVKKADEEKTALIEISIEELHKIIAERAYIRAEQRGFAPGGEILDWIDAEKEVADFYSKK